MTTEAKVTEEGRQALLDGKDQTDCPYKSAKDTPGLTFNYERCWWLEGYYNARIIAHCGPALARHGETWP